MSEARVNSPVYPWLHLHADIVVDPCNVRVDESYGHAVHASDPVVSLYLLDPHALQVSEARVNSPV